MAEVALLRTDAPLALMSTIMEDWIASQAGLSTRVRSGHVLGTAAPSLKPFSGGGGEIGSSSWTQLRLTWIRGRGDQLENAPRLEASVACATPALHHVFRTRGPT